MATASPDSPVFMQSAPQECAQTSPREQTHAFGIMTEPMSFPGTDLPCFGFVNHTKNTLRQAISTALRDPGDPPGPLGFPGPQPTSIDSKSHFETIRSGRYGIATKTDGVRACLFMYDIAPGMHLLSLFDRKMDQPYGVFIQHVPNALCQGHGTILDGELVKNLATGRWTFLVFDVVMLASFPQFHKPFAERMSGIEAALRMAYNPSDRDTVVLDIKRFVPLNEAPLTGAHLNDPRFKNDGFVLMPYDEPIVFGHHERLFKLKTTHSIDFLYRGGALMIYNQSSRRYVKAGTLDTPADIPDGVIVECVLHTYHATPAKRVWKLLMVRPDKDKSNSAHVMEKTLVNIQENLRYGDIRQLQ